MRGEHLIASLLDHEFSRVAERNSKRDEAFQNAVKITRKQIAEAFSKRSRIPARRKKGSTGTPVSPMR
jgi:hypothetical protein